ncbi:MAG: class I SAM-dependent methyltransferase [Syntrophobacteraceae bacterium]
MGYVFRNEDARHYNEWFQSEPGRSALSIEKELLHRVWSPAPPQRILEVGCGTGIFLDWFARFGHQVSGLDPSSAMLDIARDQLPGTISLERGYAEHLPYSDNSFDTVALITTLEFVDDPLKALSEALRVAKRHVLVGSLNKYSIITGQRCLERLWKPTIYRHARFFSVFGLQQLASRAIPNSMPPRWRTCLALPLSTLKYLDFLERSRYLQRHPFGHFIAMKFDLYYTMQTLQDPLFSDVPSNLRRARIHASCWGSPEKKNCHISSAEARKRSPAGRNRAISILL